MRIPRLQRRQCYLVFIIFVITAIYASQFLWKNEELPDCLVPAEVHEKLESILIQIKNVVKDLNLTYFACYNSLWGALKNKGPLPWQNTLELCILNKEVAKIDEGFLARSFKRYGLLISYNSAGGFYRVTKLIEPSPSAILTVFEQDPITSQMRRVGWIHRMLPPNSCEELNCFPPELIAPPLPTEDYGKQLVHVPRDGIEMQKYLFPYSWWKDITPENCRKDNT